MDSEEEQRKVKSISVPPIGACFVIVLTGSKYQHLWGEQLSSPDGGITTNHCVYENQTKYHLLYNRSLTLKMSHNSNLL